MKKIFSAVLGALLMLTVTSAVSADQVRSAWTYYSVDTTKWPGETVITGIDDTHQIVGYVGCHAFASNEPYASFNDIGYPNADCSKGLTLDNNWDRAGAYVTTSPAVQYGYLRERGAKFVSLPYPVYGAAHLHCGVDAGRDCKSNHKWAPDALIVGAKGSSGYLGDAMTGTYQTLTVPGSLHTVATALNEEGDVVGDYDKGVWYLPRGSSQFKLFQYDKALTIHANAVNWQYQIAGRYTDLSGKMHGFILTFWREKSPVWQSIDATYSSPTCGSNRTASQTAVYGINDHDDLAGTYVDCQGVTHGFTAIPVGGK